MTADYHGKSLLHCIAEDESWASNLSQSGLNERANESFGITKADAYVPFYEWNNRYCSYQHRPD